jgi:acyl-CoA thioester hydrolase
MSPTPLTISMRIPVAWGDMDALAHVNNTIYLRWFESARIAWWERLCLKERPHSEGLGPILARTSIDYRRPVTYPDTIEVTATTLRVGGKSVTLGYKVTSAAHGNAIVAEGETVLVLFDYKKQAAVSIDAELRQKMECGGP